MQHWFNGFFTFVIFLCSELYVRQEPACTPTCMCWRKGIGAMTLLFWIFRLSLIEIMNGFNKNDFSASAANSGGRYSLQNVEVGDSEQKGCGTLKEVF